MRMLPAQSQPLLESLARSNTPLRARDLRDVLDDRQKDAAAVVVVVVVVARIAVVRIVAAVAVHAVCPKY